MGFLADLILTGGTTTAPSIDWSSIITSSSFDGLLSGITTVLPVVVPVALVIAGIPVVWKLIKRMMRG
jgi:hypothetical protein